METLASKSFYKREIDKLIDETNDTDVLDLIYNILLAEA